MQQNRTYVAIDLKSFYASVECVERGLNPLTTNLVVADASRTDKTICLAVSPSLKAYGIPGRARLFEVVQKVEEINARRKSRSPGGRFQGSSSDAGQLAVSPALALDYIVASPRMALYMEYSTRVYQIYLKYIAPEDIHVYSIDEVFMDVTRYLDTYHQTAWELTRCMIRDVLQNTGITATAGIGSNLYLCKVAMDIEAKHICPDRDGVRIAELDEESYRRKLWDHRPLTDFWRVGRGYAAKLEAHGLYTMGDIARCSLGKPSEFHNEGLLYRLFGINAELLIDHAWGWEPCTIAEIKAYRPQSNSISTGQVLQCPYDAEKARLIVQEMVDVLALDLVDRGLVTDQVTLTLGYDRESLREPTRAQSYRGEVTMDFYGRKVPKHAHGTANFPRKTASARLLTQGILELYDRIVNPVLLVRRVTISANHVTEEREESGEPFPQISLFDTPELRRQEEAQSAALQRERKMQEAILHIKKRYGKNAIFKGMNLQEGATTIARNGQIGGHKA